MNVMKNTIAKSTVEKSRARLSVEIKKVNEKRNFFTRSFSYERMLHGFDKPLTQTVAYKPGKGVLELSVVSPTEKNAQVSHVLCLLGTYRPKGAIIRRKFAEINSANTRADYEGNGLASQLITEAVHVLQKVGVKKINVQVTTEHETIYHTLGFRCTARTPDGNFYTKEFK
jgi:GNAT superfamily N-acetyltransferase